MVQTIKKEIAIIILISLLIPPVSASAQNLAVGGSAVGIQIAIDGVAVAGLCNVETIEGTKQPALDAGIKTGDVITKVGSQEIHNASDFKNAVNSLDESPTSIVVQRNGKAKQLTLTPVIANDGGARLGLWLRDGVTGVGTVTFYDPESGIFGALGHGITSAETGDLLPLYEGKIVDASISGIIKGKRGSPGQLSGLSNGSSLCGEILLNTEYGIFGTLSSTASLNNLLECGTVKTGDAKILSTISGTTAKEYSVEINRVYDGDDEGRIMLTVTDPDLLNSTGGIVQGMSGSPIIQDEKLVGAVTHVFVNDPTKGYGLSVQTMLSSVQTLLYNAA